jgi:hypothetical protein
MDLKTKINILEKYKNDQFKLASSKTRKIMETCVPLIFLILWIFLLVVTFWSEISYFFCPC